MELGLRDRVCVVTGASRGIGAATALMLCAEEAWVLLIGRDEEQLEAAVESAREAGGPADGMVLDVTRAAAGEPVGRAWRGRFGAPVAALVPHPGTGWAAT